MSAKERTLKLPDGSTVSALCQKPKAAKAVLVLAHGAGAGMTHKNMAATADGLETRGIAVLRYNFPYMERGSKRPDNPSIAQAATRAAMDYLHFARRLAPISSWCATATSTLTCWPPWPPTRPGVRP